MPIISRMVFFSLIKASRNLIDCLQNSHLSGLHIVLGGRNNVLPNALNLCLKAPDLFLKAAYNQLHARKNDLLGKLA